MTEPRGEIRDVRSMIRPWKDGRQWWFTLLWTERETEQEALLERACTYDSAPFTTRHKCLQACTAHVQQLKGLSKG